MAVAKQPLLAETLEGDPLSLAKCGGDDDLYSCGYFESVKIVTQILNYAALFRFYQYLAISFCIIALFKCFLIISFHKRLSILSQTLYEASTDIFHWGVTLTLVHAVFATVFHYLFGPKMNNFSTWTGSFTTLLLMVIGLFDVSGKSLNIILKKEQMKKKN